MIYIEFCVKLIVKLFWLVVPLDFVCMLYLGLCCFGQSSNSLWNKCNTKFQFQFDALYGFDLSEPVAFQVTLYSILLYNNTPSKQIICMELMWIEYIFYLYTLGFSWCILLNNGHKCSSMYILDNLWLLYTIKFNNRYQIESGSIYSS